MKVHALALQDEGTDAILDTWLVIKQEPGCKGAKHTLADVTVLSPCTGMAGVSVCLSA